MDLEQNKRNAISFYEMAFLGDPVQAVDKYVGKEYIQTLGCDSESAG